MTKGTQLPLIGDPKRRGPVDIVREWHERAQEFVDEHAKILIPTVAVVFLGLVALVVTQDLSMPEVPNWVWVALIVSVIAAPYGYLLGSRLAKGLYSADVELLAIQKPVSGDIKLLTVDPDRFDDMDVVTHNGKIRDTDFLKSIRVNGVRAYEVDAYVPDRNTAVASWQAGETNSSIRAQKRQIKRIKTDLEREADKAMELLANYPEILRKHAQEIANRLIKASVGIELPEGEKLHERLSDTIEDADPSEDLLLDEHGDDDRDDRDRGSPSSSTSSTSSSTSSEPGDEDVAGDIFDKAAAMENNRQEASSDD